MYYENYILINIDIPNYEEIKKKYFDNEGNKIVLLNDNYSIHSPFEHFTPVMFVDPEGKFILSSFLIAVGIGMAFGFGGELVSDLIEGDGINHSFRQYFGSVIAGGIAGAATGLGLNMLGTLGMSAFGDTLGGLILGEIDSWESFGQTLAISLVSTTISFGISSAVSNTFGGKQFDKIIGNTKTNNIINKRFANISGSFKKLNNLKIGVNSKTQVLKALSYTNSNMALTETTSDFINKLLTVWFG